MSLDGAGTRFIGSLTHTGGRPGGCIDITIDFQATGTYPAGGELVSQFLNMTAMGTNFKVPSGVNPDAVYLGGSKFASNWRYNRATGRLRLFDDTVTEAGTGANYNTVAVGDVPATQVASDDVVTMTFRYPLYGNMSR
jgi:hypothetical protein